MHASPSTQKTYPAWPADCPVSEVGGGGGDEGGPVLEHVVVDEAHLGEILG